MAQGGWASLYDMTPDSQPVIDRVPHVEGFYCAVGFSGHGFKLGPAVGVAVAERLLPHLRPVTVSVRPLSRRPAHPRRLQVRHHRIVSIVNFVCIRISAVGS
jgi:glycine/D-amino acid oxidase-like deaminating enzyme